MPYIIDGHNLIPKIQGLSLREIDDEIELIRLLQDFCHRTRKKIEVYFDNAPPGESRTQKFGFVTAHFIRQGSTADAAIQKRLNSLGKSAQTWTVVSSDRQIQAAARARYACVIGSEDFARELRTNVEENESKNDIHLSAKEVDEWMRIFKGNNKLNSS